jgi:hypothetical protein
MATKAQIDRLSFRIDQLTEQLGLSVPVRYTVWLDFGLGDEAFLEQPTLPGSHGAH